MRMCMQKREREKETHNYNYPYIQEQPNKQLSICEHQKRNF